MGKHVVEKDYVRGEVEGVKQDERELQALVLERAIEGYDRVFADSKIVKRSDVITWFNGLAESIRKGTIDFLDEEKYT